MKFLVVVTPPYIYHDSLASHLGILDDEFEELLAAGKLGKFRSWYTKLGLCVQTYIDNSIKWIAFDEAFAPLKL